MIRKTSGLRKVWTSNVRISYVDENKSKSDYFFDYIAEINAAKKRKNLLVYWFRLCSVTSYLFYYTIFDTECKTSGNAPISRKIFVQVWLFFHVNMLFILLFPTFSFLQHHVPYK